jgi:ferredoxin-type protein NapH
VKRTDGFSVATVVVLCGTMALFEYFFLIGMSSGGQRIAAWIVAGALLALFVALQRTGRVSTFRRIFFVSSALLFAPAFIARLVESRGSMVLTQAETFLSQTPFCHIVIPQAIIPYLLSGVVVFPGRLTNYFASIYGMIAIWLIATLTIGRGWCSWVCFYGGWDDGASRLASRAKVEIRDPNKRVRYFSFAMLAFVALAGMATMTSVYCTWLCPFKIVTEYAEVTNAITFFAFILFVLAFFSMAIILPIVTRRRTQCMSFCPFGAFQSLVDVVSPYRVGIDEKLCTRCGKCAKECPVMAADPPRILRTCTKCGECVTACPTGAAGYRFSWSRACGSPRGLAARWRQRLAGAGKTRGLLPGLARALEELASPRALMTTSGFTIGMIICGSFSVETVARFLHLLTTGSFLFV